MTAPEISLFKQKALQWANSFETCCILDSNNFTDAYSGFDCIIAAGAKDHIQAASGNAFAQLKAFYEKHKKWMFGLLSYDLKNEVEVLQSSNPDSHNFPDLFFFIPESLILIKGKTVEVLLGQNDIIDLILKIELKPQTAAHAIPIHARINRKTYIQTVEELKKRISRGDIYEINYCQEFYAENVCIDPVDLYCQLTKVSPTPFGGFLKIKDQYVLSASPERFICKRDSKLISQPIKGTAKRSIDPKEDDEIKSHLRNNLKERSENVMIVDLVRNDLTKNAAQGSVKVEELFGIYSFAQVHQMISTISCQLHPDIHFIDAVKNVFPMGSMTGAPKIKAMELIEQFEISKRGAYSGAMGYIRPNGDFDFNVIIRSILYTSLQKHLSFTVGGAITYASDPLQEYEECLLKASAILKILKG